MVQYRDSTNEIWRIPKLTGPNYRVWRWWLKMLLEYEGLWDVVSPSTAAGAGVSSESRPEKLLAAKGAQSEKTESIESERPKGIIWKLCAPGPLSRILNLNSASACWERLKDMYDPCLRRLPNMLEEFMSYAPPAGKEVSDMGTDLDHLQDDIEEVCPAERPTDMMKKVVLVRAAGEMLRASKVWGLVRLRIKSLGFQETLQELEICEEMMEEDRNMAGSLGGKNRGGRKKGSG